MYISSFCLIEYLSLHIKTTTDRHQGLSACIYVNTSIFVCGRLYSPFRNNDDVKNAKWFIIFCWDENEMKNIEPERRIKIRQKNISFVVINHKEEVEEEGSFLSDPDWMELLVFYLWIHIFLNEGKNRIVSSLSSLFFF